MTAIDQVSGPVLFARYAFPPNQLGYCGPDDAAGFFTSGVSGDDQGLRRMARDFDGARPHLKLIADALGRSDPLDPEVVEAYWVGAAALDRVGPATVDPQVEKMLRGRCGPMFDTVSSALRAGAVPHHSFTVLCVYPWVGMLDDARRRTQAMIVLDRCRIRWGQVRTVSADKVTAESQSLVWASGRLRLGPPVVETVRRGIDGLALSAPIAEDDWVALHWDWVCDVITEPQRDALQHYSNQHLELVNAWLTERRAVRTDDG